MNLTNINVVPFGVWQNVRFSFFSFLLLFFMSYFFFFFGFVIIQKVDEHLRFMILMDGVHPEMDTCLIVEYKGILLLI